MVTGAKYLILVNIESEANPIAYGPFDTLPKAKEALVRVRADYVRKGWRPRPGRAALAIVKVIEEQYLGASK